MNKRFMSLLLVLVMVFSLLPISAMAQVYIFDGNDAIELDFYRNSSDAKPFNTQRVLTSGINAIYDPGCELGENEYFIGWAIEGAGTKATIDDVRAYVSGSASTLAGNTLKLTAVVSPVHYVVYYDESGRVVKTAAVVKALNNDSWNTKVNFDYIPADVNKEFYGWTTVETGSTVQYANGADIEASADTTALYPVCKSGAWVKFDENDTVNGQNIHATYQPPAFIEEGTTIDISDSKYDVEAAGYHFDGWYTAATGGTKVTNVSSAQTVYAHWTAQTVNYTVAYWQQNANDDGYSLVEVDTTRTGTAGTNATYDTNKSYANFHRKDVELVKIAGDGSTIQNVYFDRDMHTLTFNMDNRQTVTIDKTIYLFGTEDGTEYVYTIEPGTYWADGFEGLYYYYTSWGQRTTGSALDTDYWSGNYNTLYYNTSSDKENSGYSSTTDFSSQAFSKTITAKYQQYIGDNFPITNGKYDTWNPQDSTTYGNILVYIGTMPAENITFKQLKNSYEPMYMQHYVEVLPGESGTTIYGKTFKEFGNRIQASYNFFTLKEDFNDIDGFTKYRADPAFETWNSRANDYTSDPGEGGTLSLYYSRNSYDLKFFTNGGPAVENKSVLFEKPMAEYNPSNYIIGETIETINNQPMIFQGWYENEHFAGNVYNFATANMPAHAVTLYAKWAPVQYRVVLDANGGSFGEDASIQFKLDDGDKVEVNNPTNGNLQFVGWYTDPACTQRFNLDTAIKYNILTDKNWTEADEPTVHGKLTLYAKWRHTMDHNTFLTVVYDPAGGTVNGNASYTDPLSYADQAEAVAQPAAVSAVTGESFAYWEVMKPKSATDPTLVPSGVTVKPGEIFNVKMDDALNNTVTLRAHYEASKGTHIVWYGNGGTTAEGATEVSSADANLNAAISVKPADTFTRDGYEFLGWARLNENDMKDGDSWRQDDDAATAKLWLKWDGEHYTAVNDAGQTVTNPDIAANEIEPYHVLYAVWDKIDNHNYVIDFNGKMTIATSATAKKDDSHNNGAFEVADGNATYQLKADEKDYTNGANLAFNGIDTALINGVPVGSAEGATASWEKYTVIPANNVYFDDSLVEASMIAGDDNSIKAAVKANEDSPENGQEKTSLVFTFYGTGIDVYCTTDKDAGWIQANVDGTAYPFVNSRYQESEGSTTAIYNTPVISIDGLAPNVEHTLTLRTLTGANYRLDGIRVYNAMQGVGDEATQAAVNKAYDDADESNAVFLEVRDRILAANKFVVDGASDADIGTITGAVFLETKAEGATIADYTAKGPKDEVYLAPNQAIAFNLGGWTAGNYKVMVGLSMPKSTDNGTATVYASGRGTSNPITVSARTDMFYEITPDASGNVIIKNNGDGMISVTKLKITTIKDSGADAYTVPAQTTGEPAAEGARGLRVTKSLMAYAMAFNPETEAAPAEPQNPDTPEEPDDPKPGWNDGAFNPMSILKNLFQNLLDGLGKLFGNLPKW